MLIICSLNNILTGIGLLISAGMLILAFIAYNKFLSNKVNEFQLNTVIEFINEIQKNENLVVFNQTSRNHVLTIIDMVHLKEFENKHSNIYFKKPAWSFYEKYYTNPLLPKSIAIKLREFNIYQWDSKSISEIEKEPFILISDFGSYDDDTKVLFIKGSKLEKSRDFKKAVSELIKSIEKWAKRYNIDDINLATSKNYKAEYFLK